MNGGRSPMRKGKNAEREVARLIREAVPWVTIERNLAQAGAGGPDLLGLAPYGIEVKRAETLALDAWWRQAVRGAVIHALEPLLVYRTSRKAWRCMAWATPPACGRPIRVDMILKDFLASYCGLTRTGPAHNPMKQDSPAAR